MSRGPEQLRLTPDERADLVAYIDGELPEGMSRSLSTKLTHSATGRREVEMLKKTWELLGHLPLPEPAPQFTERTITEIRRLEMKSPVWDPRVKTWTARAGYLVVYVALAALGLGLGYVATRWVWPDPSARLARDLSLAEHLDEYLEAGSFDFLQRLADSPDFSPDTP
jgi:anti-sigma factor RsiW